MGIPAVCAALLLVGAVGCRDSDADRARRELADLVVQTREIELESLSHKVDPESLNLPRRIQSIERSLHDIHEKFEKSLEAFEEFNHDLEEEIRELREKIEALHAIEGGPTGVEAWLRYWEVAEELDRVKSLSWRER